MRYEEVELRQLEHGDQIAVVGNVADLSPLLRPFVAIIGDTYYHHGIYDKENMAVIDFHGESKEDAKPQKRDFTKFYAGHSTLYRVVYEDGEQCLAVSETMKMAEEAVKRQSSWPDYHLIKNNCETFATYLKTGRKPVSKQVVDAMIEITDKVEQVVHPIAAASGASVGSVGGAGSLGASGPVGSSTSGN